MNHPTPEEWMSCLYGEADPQVQASAAAHLERCPECREQVARWKSAQALLGEDRATLVPPPRRRGSNVWAQARPLLAASVILAAGFFAGRLAGPSRAEMREELAQARSQIEADLRLAYRPNLEAIATAAAGSVARENRRWQDEISAQWAAARIEDQTGVQTLLRQLETRQESDRAAVQVGLIGLARYTGSGFEQAESQFHQLSQTKWSQPAPNPNERSLTPSIP